MAGKSLFKIIYPRKTLLILYKSTIFLRLSMHQAKPKNIIILLQDNIGAFYVDTLGGLSISSELNTIGHPTDDKSNRAKRSFSERTSKIVSNFW